ncbi:MAG TPA: GNAT family N-acetyltransferase [Flavobacteriales bacterium]|nr:GNAT family N-acetyltransferase [Flavobacteriales bacterium]
MMEIVNCIPADLDMIFDLFESAIAYQKQKGYDLWPVFNRTMVETDVREERQWKIIEGNSVLCVFTVMYNDPVIWLEKDDDPAIYLHRITVNPLFKGQRMMEVVKSWALNHAREKGKKFVRMDTWGNNENLRNYYVSCGFAYIGQQELKHVEGLPDHYGGTHLSLFEIEVNR